MTQKPSPFLVEWEDPALVRRICPTHATAPAHDDCPLQDRDPEEMYARRGFPTKALAFAYANRITADPMTCVTERTVTEDDIAPGLWDVIDVRSWYRTMDGWDEVSHS